MAITTRASVAPLLLCVLVASCAPRVHKLQGIPLAVPLPNPQLAPGHRQLVFQWEYSEPELLIRGEGVARIAAPDSVRLDLFLGNGLGGGRALLIGDTLTTPGNDFVHRYLPPPTLLWAALGRLALPPARDTTARVDGKTVRADIGHDPQWRITLLDSQLVRVERIDDRRLREWVERRPSGRIVYHHETARRTLSITVNRTEELSGFDASIWNH